MVPAAKIIARAIHFWIALLLVGLMSHGVLSIESSIDADANSLDDPLTMMDRLCVNGNKRITRISTIRLLSEYLDANPEIPNKQDHETECIESYRPVIKELVEVVDNEANHQSVCSFHQVVKMSHFHWKFVVGKLDRWWAKSLDNSAPKALVLFFINYANRVARLCMSELTDNLKLAAKGEGYDTRDVMSSSLGRSLNRARLTLVAKNDIKYFDDFILVWQTIANKLKLTGAISATSIDEKTDTMFGNLRVRSAQKIWKLQDTCRYTLRPIYQETVLPVMLLIDMGYGPVTKSDRLDDNELVKDWYYITQMCELSLKVQFHEDSTLDEGETRKVERQGTMGLRSHPSKSRETIPVTDAVKKLQVEEFVDPINSITSSKLMAQVRHTISTRATFLGQVFEHLVKQVINRPAIRLRRLFSRCRDCLTNWSGNSEETSAITESSI